VGALVFAAANADEAALETRRNGIFTEALIDILEDPASDSPPPDQQLSFSELRWHLETRVKALSKQRPSPYIEMPPGMSRDIPLFQLPTASGE
jgi:hypothetical protein